MIVLEMKKPQGMYDDVISLGENCYTAIHLKNIGCGNIQVL